MRHKFPGYWEPSPGQTQSKSIFATVSLPDVTKLPRALKKASLENAPQWSSEIELPTSIFQGLLFLLLSFSLKNLERTCLLKKMFLIWKADYRKDCFLLSRRLWDHSKLKLGFKTIDAFESYQ